MGLGVVGLPLNGGVGIGGVAGEVREGGGAVAVVDVELEGVVGDRGGVQWLLCGRFAVAAAWPPAMSRQLQ